MAESSACDSRPPRVNSPEYWDQRFATGHWEERRGREQTVAFARKQCDLVRLPRDFRGTLLDFGCGLGDAIPVYRERWPDATLIGVDHAEAAIQQCRARYGNLAQFLVASYQEVPPADVIIASNVLEHLENDAEAAAALAAECKDLYVFVPYRERLTPGSEHVNSYDEHSFAELAVGATRVFTCRRWSQYGRALWAGVYLKNLARPFFGKPVVRRSKQIMFHVRGGASNRGAT